MSHSAAEHRDHMGLPADYVVDGVLAYGTWDLFAETAQLPHLRAALEAIDVGHRLIRIDEPLIGHAYELLTDAGRRYWFIPVMGTAVIATYLHLGSLFGSRTNILLGTVGGLAPGMNSGDLIVPSAIVGNDSARMYDRENRGNIYRPDPTLIEELRHAMTDLPRVWSGTTTTCEMMLAETQRDVDEWSAAGLLGVEMEGALTFALSRHFSIPSVALFFVTDNLAEKETVLSSAHKAHKAVHEEQRALQYRLGLQLLLK